MSDRDSQNGTFVNGIPVKARVLVNGDQIAVGSSVFVFLWEELDQLSGAAPLLRVPDRPAAPPLQHRLIGESAAIRHALEFIAKVAHWIPPC